MRVKITRDDGVVFARSQVKSPFWEDVRLEHHDVIYILHQDGTVSWRRTGHALWNQGTWQRIWWWQSLW